MTGTNKHTKQIIPLAPDVDRIDKSSTLSASDDEYIKQYIEQLVEWRYWLVNSKGNKLQKIELYEETTFRVEKNNAMVWGGRLMSLKKDTYTFTETGRTRMINNCKMEFNDQHELIASVLD